MITAIVVIIAAIIMIFANEFTAKGKAFWQKQYIRHISLLLVLSFFCLAYLTELQLLLARLTYFCLSTGLNLLALFPMVSEKQWLAGFLVLIITPFILPLCASIIYYLIKKKPLPYLYTLVWVSWLILSLVLVATIPF